MFFRGRPRGLACTDVSKTYYYYGIEGNVTRVVTEVGDPAPGSPASYSAVRMEYARNGRTVVYAMGETWNRDVLTLRLRLGL